MKSYEGMFVFSPEISIETAKEQLKNVENLITKFQGQLVQAVEMGKRPLGYLVRKFREGQFFLLEYKLDPSKATEFRNSVQLQDDVIKFMITVKNEKAQKKLLKQAEAGKAPRPAVQAQPAAS